MSVTMVIVIAGVRLRDAAAVQLARASKTADSTAVGEVSAGRIAPTSITALAGGAHSQISEHFPGTAASVLPNINEIDTGGRCRSVTVARAVARAVAIAIAVASALEIVVLAFLVVASATVG